jgi:hypothetical protein
MHAHVAHINPGPDQLEQYLTHLRTSVVPEAREQPGYKGILVLSDPETGRTIGIGLWETAAHRQAVDDSGFTEAQVRKTGPLMRDPIGIEHWEVSIVDGDLTTK